MNEVTLLQDSSTIKEWSRILIINDDCNFKYTIWINEKHMPDNWVSTQCGHLTYNMIVHNSDR